MADSIPAEEQTNYETFRDCMSEPIMKALALPAEKEKKKTKRMAKKRSKYKPVGMFAPAKPQVEMPTPSAPTGTDAEDLGEFIDYLSSLIFPSLPASLRTLSYPLFRDTPYLRDAYTTPLSASTCTALLSTLPPDALDSLESYTLLPTPHDTTDIYNFFTPVFTAYCTATTLPPPIWVTTRTTACELCERDWVPLTYHHLIPKSTHDRVRKRGWHDEEVLNSVAWLCRACHSFVHRLASNEGLARGYYTVDLILEGGVEGDEGKRAEVEGWVKWVGGVRWKSR
ncbi:proline-specific permease [Stagonosporopsis vannaccii]|nr:proline-specific permease [Stagonosporopsis vannaccii]